MKKIQEIKTIFKDKIIKNDIYELDENEKVKNISRVYVIAIGKNKKIPLIFNSKRSIWGFPGGHIEKKESLQEAACREFAEETGYRLKQNIPKYVIVNSLGDIQVICFGTINGKTQEYNDPNETVSLIKFASMKKITDYIGNAELWDKILKDFICWSKKI